jgi:hypothetical protein
MREYQNRGITLSQLGGHSFAYSAPASTSSHLYPAHGLKANGIDPDSDVQAVYAGSHTASFEAIRNHKVDTGELNSDRIATAGFDNNVPLPNWDAGWTTRGAAASTIGIYGGTSFVSSVTSSVRTSRIGPTAVCWCHPRVLKLAFVATLLLLAAGPTAVAQELSPEPGYLDDRSTPEATINSYYDAVNKREYARAYSYWEPSAAERELPQFDEFANGYTDTSSVQVTLGTIISGVGAGQLYYSVPVTLAATMSDGSAQTFVGCYTLHLGRPQLQAVPPFQPMAIQHASISRVDNDVPTSDLMPRACTV